MMSDKQKPLIGITLGDLNGVGPEVIIKALSDNRILRQLTPIVFGSSKVIAFYKKLLDHDNFQYVQIGDIHKHNPKKTNVINIWEEKLELTPGSPNKTLGKYALRSVETASDHLKNNHIHAMVTAPIDKFLVQDENFNFPGHTEYLTQKFERKQSLMFMVSEAMRIGVVTGHIPLSEVPKVLTQELIREKLQILIKSLTNDFGLKKPKVAVLGLNPHAGDNGLLGKEEEQLISPIIQDFKNKNHLVFGPFSADGFFGSRQSGQYDGILSMYHDQGLIPFKQFAFGEGINFTAGLSHIRTSPDHGTGFEIAGKNLADASSFRNALFLAADLARKKLIQ